MTTATLYDLVPRVALDLPRCPENAIREALRRALRLFCQDAEAWRHSLDITLVTGQDAYPLSVPFEADVRRLDKIHIRTASDVASGLEGMPLNPDECTLFGTYPSLSISLGHPAYQSLTGLTLTVRMVLVPRLGDASAGDLPDEILNEYGDALAAKAAAILSEIPGRPYSNEVLAGVRTMEYNQAKSRARRVALSGRLGKVGFTK